MLSFRGKVWIGIIIITVLLWSLLLSGCKSKKEIIETHSTDTIYKSEVITIDKPQLSEIVFNNPCDSLGKLNPIFYTYTTDNVKATLKSEHNSLKLEINLDSIKQSAIKEYKSSVQTENKETPVPYIPDLIKKLLGISLLLNLIAGAYIFRKPLLKLISPI